MNVDTMLKELFTAGAITYVLSIFSTIFNPPVAKLLKSISYMCIAFFALLILFQLWETVKQLIEALQNIAKLNPFN